MIIKVQDVLGEGGHLLIENIIVSVGPIVSSWKVSHCVKHTGKYEAGTVPNLKELIKKQQKTQFYIVLALHRYRISQAT